MKPPHKRHVAFTIATRISRYVPVREIGEIWEIGSRDGLDGLEMLRAFPAANLQAFEPNPDTYSLVETAAEEGGSRFQSHPIALCDTNGPIVFHKIDRERTATQWSDGNPGASGLFKASGAYSSIEDYVQVPVQVIGARAESLIEAGLAPVPDFIWMDVQGAELLVLNGFGHHLTKVNAIYAELSLREIYAGQAMAKDVVRILEPDFCWHSVLRTGEWQFDALFISRSLADRSLRVRDRTLRASLQSGVMAGIAYPVAGQAAALGVARRAEPGLRGIDNRTLGKGGVRVARAYQEVRSGPLPLRLRQVLEAVQPQDPLARERQLPEIDIVIPCHAKDLATVGIAIEGARAASQNPIKHVRLIAPEEHLPAIANQFPGTSCESDEYILGAALLGSVRKRVPEIRQGWIVQQLAKLLAVMQGSTGAGLVVDADTILLKQRTWLSHRNEQLLCVSHEYHRPYVTQSERMWGRRSASSPVSFVTHHQLMQKWAIREMFGEGSEGLRRWLENADWEQPSAVSEYHSYGAWLSRRYPRLAIWAQWSNQAVSRDLLATGGGDAASQLAHLKSAFPGRHSVSLHNYMPRTRVLP